MQCKVNSHKSTRIYMLDISCITQPFWISRRLRMKPEADVTMGTRASIQTVIMPV